MGFKPGNKLGVRSASRKAPIVTKKPAVKDKAVVIQQKVIEPVVVEKVVEEPEIVVKPDPVPENPQKDRFDIGVFHAGGYNAQPGRAFTETLDPGSTRLWEAYMRNGYQPISMTMNPRENKLFILFKHE